MEIKNQYFLAFLGKNKLGQNKLGQNKVGQNIVTILYYYLLLK